MKNSYNSRVISDYINGLKCFPWINLKSLCTLKQCNFLADVLFNLMYSTMPVFYENLIALCISKHIYFFNWNKWEIILLIYHAYMEELFSFILNQIENIFSHVDFFSLFRKSFTYWNYLILWEPVWFWRVLLLFVWLFKESRGNYKYFICQSTVWRP